MQLHLYLWMMRHGGYLRPDEAAELYIVHLAPGEWDPGWIAAMDLEKEADAVMRGRREDLKVTRAAIELAGKVEPEEDVMP